MSIYTLLRGKGSMFIVFAFALLFSSLANAQISVTATGGTTTGSYTTLRAAILAINAGTHQGVINLSVTGNTNETAQSTLNQSGSGSCSYTSIIIKPAPAVTPTISGNIATGILYTSGSNLTIDGSNTVGGTSKDLSIVNTNATSDYVIRFAPVSTALGSSNNTIKNCILTNASTTGTFCVILAGSNNTLGASSEAPNSNNTIQNNDISGAQEGFYAYGAATLDNNWTITGNNFNNLGFDGILLWNASNFTISNNLITNVSINGSSAVTGINFSWTLSGGNIWGNNISSISNASAFGCYGVYFDLVSTASNVNIYNNMIYNVSSRANATVYKNGFGIYMDGGGGVNIYSNSVDLITNQVGTPANGKTAALCFDPYATGTISNNSINVKNNILVNNQTAGSRYGIYSSVNSAIFTSIDYNDYYGATGLGFLTSARTTIPAMTTGFGGNINSISYNPAFISTTDLHLTNIAANNVLASGTPITTPSITTDIDGNTRSTTTPTMGADELTSNKITYTLLAATCDTTSQIMIADTITSGTGVPTTGANVPQIYFRKNAGAWFHSAGTLTTGTATSGNWTFTISSATMGGVTGGDIISYYVIAQTTGGTVFSTPSAGLVATDVNTVTTAPTTPNTFAVNMVSLTGLVTAQSACYNPSAATTASFAYTGSVSSPNQYTLTWSPAGPTNVSAFTTLPTGGIAVSVPTGTAANTYTGTLTIKNSITGCTTNYTLTLTVNAPPANIAGLFTLCTGGNTTTLTDATSGGTWSGGSPAVATITASGMVTSVAIGTTIVTYTAPITGCTDTALVTVIGLPSAITGSTVVCYGGGVTTLSTTTTGGSWSSGNLPVATIDAVTGAVYGVSAGTAVISYVMPSGCYVTTPVTVNAPLPAISGPSAVCPGLSIALANTATGGTWTSGTLSAATVTSGGSVGGVAAGSSIITYSTSVGCNTYKTITVNPLPAAITGPSSVCAGNATIALSNASTGGTWSNSGPLTVATLTSGGVVTGVAAGAVTITYTLPTTGCYATAPITVNPLPVPISGAAAVCENGGTAVVTNITGTGTWSASPTANLSVDALGTITGGAAGAATVSYTLATGCYVTRAITVNPAPAAIAGSSSVCVNSTTLLTDATASGTWSTSAAGTASISAGGTMTGVASGTATITYTLPLTGCYATLPVTVNALPVAITGATTTVCGGGATINLTNTTGGGTWSSGATTVATVDAVTGTVYGSTAGTAPITYTVTASGCYTSTNVTVLPAPAAIGGLTSVCEGGGVTTLSDATTPGTWSISAGTTAVITPAGMVTGNTAGNATVTYTGGNNCYVTQLITVKPLPGGITGASSVCQASVIVLSSTSAGGSWTVGNPFIAAVNASGNLTGLTPGTTTVTYTLPTGCSTNTSITVNAVPGVITGSPSICLGGTSALNNSVAGGVWSTSNSSIASVDASGTAYGIALGNANISYTTGTSGCYAVLPVTVTSIVTPNVALNITPSSTVCEGTAVTYSAAITNGGASPLYVWSVNNMILSGASSYTYVPADNDLVRCWIVSSYACAIPDTASAWVYMTVHPIVTPGLSLSIPGGDTVCTGSTTTVSAITTAGGTAPSYMWHVNMVNVANSPTLTRTFNNGDIVTATMTSNAFCRTAPTATSTKVITVSNLLTPMVTMATSLGLTTCEGYPEVFTASQVNGGYNPTYQWSVNGASTTTGNVFSYAPANNDNVAVTMTSSFPCLLAPTATVSNNITVLPITQPTGVITAQPGYIIPAGKNDTFTCTITSGGGIAPTYQWYKDNVPMAGATNNVYITNNLLNGDSISCEVTNTDQCSGVTVFNSLLIIIGENVGVHTLAQQGGSIVLVPNPNSGSFSIKGSLGVAVNEEVTLEISDMLGRKVYSGKARLVNGELDERVLLRGNIANGSYLLNLQSEHISKQFHFVLEQ